MNSGGGRNEIKGGDTIHKLVTCFVGKAWRSGIAVACVVAFAAPSAVAAQQVSIPAPTGVINDFGGVLDDGAEQRMTRIAEDVRSKSRGEMTVVTLPDIGQRAVADVALEIGRQWKVGKIGDPGDPTRNAGAVILLVPKETSSDGRGHCFVATGAGAEGFITDGTAGEICRQATPAFRARDYSTGLELVTLLTARRFATEFNFSIDTALIPAAAARGERGSGGGRGISPVALLILFIVVMQLLSRASRRGRRGRRKGCGGGMPIFMPIPMGGGRGGGSWGGGGFGGGGGGFGGFGGGGGFSGGGGGSSW